MTFKRKSIVTVREATEQAFQEMPQVFNAYTLCRRVKALTARPFLMDGTILRRLREIRADSKLFQYRCIDSDNALYKKIIVISE